MSQRDTAGLVDVRSAGPPADPAPRALPPVPATAVLRPAVPPVQHGFTLTFVDRQLERAFHLEQTGAALPHVRFSLLLACCLYAVFGLLDSSIIPDARDAAWFIRYGVVCPFILLALALSFRPGVAPHLTWLTGTMVCLAGGGIIAMTVLAAPPGNYLYYAGLLLTCAYAYVFLRLRWIVAAGLAWSIFLAYEVVALLTPGAQAAIVLNNTFFLVAINIIGMSAAYSMERTLRQAFTDRLVIQEQAVLLNRALASAENARHTAEEASRRDPLTGLYNRRFCYEFMRAEVGYPPRGTLPLAFLMVDIDHFKLVNDRHGHPAGDRVLQAVAERMRASLRRHDTLCRYGGEEFLVLLPETDVALAVAIAERLRVEIGQLQIDVGSAVLSLTISVGVALYPAGTGDRVDSVVDRADHALLDAKRAGRDRVVAA